MLELVDDGGGFVVGPTLVVGCMRGERDFSNQSLFSPPTLTGGGGGGGGGGAPDPLDPYRGGPGIWYVVWVWAALL